jgi:hypothetical protein
MSWFDNTEERRAAFKKVCFRHELDYLDKDEYGMVRYLESFELFRHKSGTVKHLSHRKSINLDFEINLFDYSYVVSTGKTTITVQQTVFFVNSKSLDLPIFLLRPEHLGHRIMEYFGSEDIDFDQYPVFSEKYRLTGENEDFIRSAFDDKVLRYFSEANGWHIEATNYYLVYYEPSKLCPVEELDRFYSRGEEIYQLFKVE